MMGGSVLLVVAIVLSTTSATLPTFFEELLRKCHFDSEKTIDDCFESLLEGARPHLKRGIPEWKTPSIEPLKIKSVWFKHGTAGNKVRGDFNDLQVQGLTNYKLDHVKTDVAENKASVGLLFPKINIEGIYNASGSVLLMSVKGNGPFHANLTSVRTDTDCFFETSRPAGAHGPKRIHLAKTKTDFKIGHIQVRFDNAFNGDEFLGETVNIFLNENASTLLEEISPQLSNEIDKVVIQLFEEAAAAIPADKWEKIANDRSPAAPKVVIA